MIDKYNFNLLKKDVACSKCQYFNNEQCESKEECFWKKIEKELEALQIIKKKWVNVAVLIHSKTVEEYNNNAHTPYNLTQEEFELLKEVLEDE